VKLYILPLIFTDNGLLEHLSSVLSKAFRIPAFIRPESFSLEEGFDPVRNQYNSTWILSKLLEEVPEENCKILGVTSVDLFVPVLTFVFGEAQLQGKAAVVSSYRLRDELYGLPRNPERLKERLEKEAIHELGHTFGIVHCRNPECVMHSYTYAEEVDFKSKDFCSSCSVLLDQKRRQAAS
jgi:archaemetzincin